MFSAAEEGVFFTTISIYISHLYEPRVAKFISISRSLDEYSVQSHLPFGFLSYLELDIDAR